MKLILSCLLPLMFSACVSSKKMASTMDSWMGSYKYELVQQWGAPDKIVPDENGGEILIYSNRVYAQLSSGATVDYYLYRMLYADPNGKLYHWFWKKSPNPPERIDVRMLVTYK